MNYVTLLMFRDYFDKLFCFSKFKFKNIEAAIGDYVLISNADAAESDTVEGCDIGQITKLYESHDMDLEDRFRAHVQWFCRSSDVPLACFTSDIHLENFELVEDHRPFDSDVSIETFYKKCNVMKMPTTAIISEPKANKIPTFICRFRLIALSKKKLFLEPILEDERQHFDRINSLAMTPKTPKTRTKENLVMKTPDSLIKKFSRTSLNNDSWSIKKSNVSKLVFMRDITNSYDKSPSTKASLPRNVPKPASVTPIKIINRSVVTKKCSDNEIKNFLASDDDDSDTEMTPQSVKRTLNFEKHSLINNEVENTPNRTRSNRSVKSNSKYKDHVGVPTSPQVSKDFSTPKKSRKSHVTTPKRKSIKSESDSEDDFKPLKSKTLTPKVIKTPRKSIRRSEIIPCIKAREKPICIKGYTNFFFF